MAKQTIHLLRSEEVAEGTMAFHFEKPAGFEYATGQSVDLTLIAPRETDAEGNTRAFSIASAPHEKELMIATRMRDTAFKRVLRTLPVGSAVEVDGPFGSFTLHNDTARPAVFLTGGIGITPVRAILLDASARKLPHDITVLYSNRRPEDAAFLEELERVVKDIPHAKFVATMTGMDTSAKAWSGRTGYIDARMISETTPERSRAIFYLDGPPAMVAAMRKALQELAIDSDNIRTEEFPGY